MHKEISNFLCAILSLVAPWWHDISFTSSYASFMCIYDTEWIFFFILHLTNTFKTRSADNTTFLRFLSLLVSPIFSLFAINFQPDTSGPLVVEKNPPKFPQFCLFLNSSPNLSLISYVINSVTNITPQTTVSLFHKMSF